MAMLETAILFRAIGGQSLDWKKLEEIFDEIIEGSNYESYEEILNELESRDGEYVYSDFNGLMYYTLDLYASLAKEKLIKHYPELREEVEEKEINIYTNYLDSGFDNELNNWTLKDLDEKENAEELLKDWNIFEAA